MRKHKNPEVYFNNNNNTKHYLYKGISGNESGQPNFKYGD
jgi:hypothetical protein